MEGDCNPAHKSGAVCHRAEWRRHYYIASETVDGTLVPNGTAHPNLWCPLMTTAPSIDRSAAGRSEHPSVLSHLRAAVGWDITDRRRMLQLGLGLIWLIDAALQFQSFMFTEAFPQQIMAPTAIGVPGVLGESITGMAHFIEPHIAAWNTLFALAQLAIALGIVWKRSVRWALAGSVVWSLGVWWFGEGFGGLFTAASPTMGLPGAVLIYALIAILVFPVPAARDAQPADGPLRSVAERSPIGVAAARVIWAAVWIGFAVYQLLPSNRGADSLSGMVSGMGSGEPDWVNRLDVRMSEMYAGHGALISFLFAIACVVIGLSVFARWDNSWVLVLAVLVGVWIWLAEDFGGVLTGSGTDVNSGPLIVLLALTYWRPRRVPNTPPDPRSATSG